MACASRRIRARGGDSVGHRFIAFCGAGLHIPRAGLCQGAGGKKIPPGTASNCAFCPMAASSGLFCYGRVSSELTRHFLWLALRALPAATSHSASCGMVTPFAKRLRTAVADAFLALGPKSVIGKQHQAGPIVKRGWLPRRACDHFLGTGQRTTRPENDPASRVRPGRGAHYPGRGVGAGARG